MRRALHIAVILFGTAGYARAQDLTALDSPSFVLWSWICRLLLPSAALRGHFHSGLFAWAQVPLILLALGCAWVVIRGRLESVVWRSLVLAFTYIVATSATNQWAFAHRRDTSTDFPIARVLASLDYQTPPSESEVLARLGQPLAREVLASTDSRLPHAVSRAMTEFGLSSSIVLAYRESSWGREITHFVLFDSSSARLRTAVSFNSPYPEPITWPNHALQRTAPRVTVAADSGLGVITPSHLCPTSVASFCAPPSQLPRHAPPSLSLGSLGVLCLLFRE